MPTLSELTLGIFKNDPAIFDALDAAIVLSEHPHPRARIRDWVVARLKAGALLPAKIQVNRETPTALREAPLVLVYMLTEDDVETFDEAPLTFSRAMTLALQVIVPETALIPTGVTMDEVGDAFAYAFEALLLCDINERGLYFGAQATDCVPLRTQYALQKDKTERLFLHARSEWRITYQTTPARPATNSLEVVHADWDLGPEPDGVIIEAQDVVEIEQD